MKPGWDLQTRILRIPYREPFRIARSQHGGAVMSTVIVELRSERLPGLVGLGEGCPDGYYGETVGTVPVVMDLLLDAIDPGDLDTSSVEAAAASLEAIGSAFDAAIRGHGAARCALDVALHDLAGKATGTPIHRLLGLSAEIPPTDFTLGIDEPAVVAERARRAARFPALKIKVGGPSDLATLKAVRAVYGGALRVDANTSWTPDMAASLIPELVDLGVELIEQPFPPRRYDWLMDLQAASHAADRGRRERRHDRGPRRPRRHRRRRQREAGQVRRPRAGVADARPRPGARLPDVPGMHGGDERRESPPRRPSRRSPTGPTWMVASSWQTTPSRGSCWATTAAGSFATCPATASRPGRSPPGRRPRGRSAGPAGAGRRRPPAGPSSAAGLSRAGRRYLSTDVARRGHRRPPNTCSCGQVGGQVGGQGPSARPVAAARMGMSPVPWESSGR